MTGADHAASEFKRFRELASKLVAVPKSEVPKRKLVKRKPQSPEVS